MIDIDNGGDDESYLVLEKHHQKNRTVRPPDPRTNGKAAALAAPSFHRSSAPAAHSSSNASRKNHPTQSSATSSAPRAAPKPVPHAQASSVASRTIHATQPSSGPPQPSQAHGNNKSGNTRNTNNNDDARHDNTVDTDDNDGDVSDAAAGITIRRRSNLKTERLPTQLRFYSGCWVDVLKDAKYHYRLHIHTEEPFPERSRNSLTVAHERLLEAIGKFQEEVKLELDEGLLQFFSIEIY